MYLSTCILSEPVHDISNNVVYATSKASDQPVHMRSLMKSHDSNVARNIAGPGWSPGSAISHLIYTVC